MEFKDKNLLNVFNPSKVTAESLSSIALSLLPAAFVARTIESALVYLLLALVFFIITTMLMNAVQRLVPVTFNYIFIPLTFVSAAIFVSLISSAFFVNFAQQYNSYVVLLSVSALPYMLDADNLDKNIHLSLLNTLQTFIGFSIVMLLIAIFREVLGTGMITFGTFTDITYQIDLFSKYALTVLNEPLGSFIALGFIIAIVKGKGDFIWFFYQLYLERFSYLIFY